MICKYCKKDIFLRYMGIHLKDAHMNEFETSQLSVIDHFTPKPTVKDFKWICKHCGTDVAYSSMRLHLKTVLHRNLDIGSSVKEHFTRGDLIVREKEHPTNYLWKCKYCRQQVGYKSILSHLQSKKHEDVVIESTRRKDLAANHFSRGDRLKSCDGGESSEEESEDEVLFQTCRPLVSDDDCDLSDSKSMVFSNSEPEDEEESEDEVLFQTCRPLVSDDDCDLSDSKSMVFSTSEPEDDKQPSQIFQDLFGESDDEI